MTTINTSFDGALIQRWLKAWSIALPAAIIAAYAFRPLAWRLAQVLARLWSKSDDGRN